MTGRGQPGMAAGLATVIWSLATVGMAVGLGAKMTEHVTALSVFPTSPLRFVSGHGGPTFPFRARERGQP